MNYSEWCSVASYKGWVIHCDSFRLTEKYIAPVQPYADKYYLDHIKKKKGGKQNESVFDDKIDNPITIRYLRDNGFYYSNLNGVSGFIFDFGRSRFAKGDKYVETDMVLIYHEATNNFHLLGRCVEDSNGWLSFVYKTLDILINPDRYTLEIYMNNLLKNKK